MRAFYVAHQNILQTAPAKSSDTSKVTKLQTLPAKTAVPADLYTLAQRFPLPWSHYVRLLAVKKEAARGFYETEAIRGGWSIRQLERQIGTQFYERTLMSRKKTTMPI